MADDNGPVLIVGAGLAGLCCARRLQQAGAQSLVLEASDGVGGRVRTDHVDGFLLDRGFQVLLTAYPEAQDVLDYGALDLRAFYPGALVRAGGRFRRVPDAWRRPLDALLSLFSPIGSWKDMMAVARMRSRLLRGPSGLDPHSPETTTLEALREAGVGSGMIDRFFRPFFGGILLDRSLSASSRMFEFVFRMMAQGNVSVPARGMGAIPEQIADRLTEGSIRTGARVAGVEPGAVRLESGEILRARAVVIATDGPAAARLVPELTAPGSRSVTCIYYAAERAPLRERVLVLSGEEGPINNMAVLSRVAPDYAPPGAHLVSVSCLGTSASAGSGLEDGVRDHLVGWFGKSVREWRHLRTYHIPHAQPAQDPPALSEPEREVSLGRGLYVCGDHRDNASINGAMVSGRRAAEAVLADLSDV